MKLQCTRAIRDVHIYSASSLYFEFIPFTRGNIVWPNILTQCSWKDASSANIWMQYTVPCCFLVEHDQAQSLYSCWVVFLGMIWLADFSCWLAGGSIVFVQMNEWMSHSRKSWQHIIAAVKMLVWWFGRRKNDFRRRHHHWLIPCWWNDEA